MEFSRYRKKMPRLFMFRSYRDLLFKTNAFFAYLFYFISLSCLGFGILKALKPRTESYTPTNIDLFYTSVSAATVSSMSAVEMEVFSNAQLIVMTAMMLVGGEVFTSMARLLLNAFLKNTSTVEDKVESRPPHNICIDQIELSIVATPDDHSFRNSNNSFLKYDSIKFLGFVVLGYLVVIQLLGIVAVFIYLALVSSAENVLRNKGIKTSTFVVFTVVSTFASCGFVPTNENMIVFSKNSGLLLILIPQILLGNTLFPCGLRVVIWILGRKFNRVEAEYLLNSSGKQTGFQHLFPALHSLLLAATVFGFLFISIVLFSSLEWNTAGLDGLNTYQKVVGIVFQSANARHAGETIVDLSTLSPAILVFFVIMMYLPPYTSFLPIEKAEVSPLKFEGKETRKNRVVENILFSQLSYLAIFIVLICITERKSLKEDPLNFSVMNITLEVISAYGNVGFTTGYSCGREVRSDPKCVDKLYGFSAKWSDEGKIILILVMFFGRLKQFNMKGGRAWDLL